MNERNGFVGCFGAEDVTKGDILETDLLANVVVIRYVDPYRPLLVKLHSTS